MAISSANSEVVPATEEQINSYYESAAQKINLLLNCYGVRNAVGQLEEVSVNQLKHSLSLEGFFQATILQAIFFDHKQQYVPEEIIQAFRNIISAAPFQIKTAILEIFVNLLATKGWETSLSRYFEQTYHFPKNGIIELIDLKDFSLGFGVYKATFQLSLPEIKKVTIFLKQAHGLRAYNEQLYFYLQKAFLSTAKFAKMPWLVSSAITNETLLLSPLMSGVESDIALSLLKYEHDSAENSEDKSIIKKALEVLIETFIEHSALGDLLGRNDRHLMNSLIFSVADGIPQTTAVKDLVAHKNLLTFANKIAENKAEAFGLIDIDLKWLLEEKNYHWIFADIDFGLSEINLLSLLDEFNNVDAKNNQFLETRKKYIAYYFAIYTNTQKVLLENQALIFSAIKTIYPLEFAEKKLMLLAQQISYLENNRKCIIKVFEHYLLNYRIRLAHKETLFMLYKIAKKSNNVDLLTDLRHADLLKYLPPDSAFDTYEPSVILELQCFRGVLSRKDQAAISQHDRVCWEGVASNISLVAEQHNQDLFTALEEKKKFISQDTEILLNFIELLLS